MFSINFDDLVNHREICKEMSKDKFDLIIKSQLLFHRREYVEKHSVLLILGMEKPYKDEVGLRPRVPKHWFKTTKQSHFYRSREN
ncbi:hypothetical protein KUTeg_000798 [Tegillarca granosa]|uniref:Uncharacterized protein n=1 Tax=Tegillarca granosa TaxID=220873 RepID=A0ABQ9FYK4_TEGGR|nr:hypothetical protein KUTeg_000798 [Tegillarca granosa]